MSKVFENIKGTYDYLPQKQIIREQIKSVLQTEFAKYGFAPAETPILCPYDLLASKYSEGADILNEMYKLSDQGKRKLGLRFDLTITFSKLISSNPDLLLPFKRYEIGKVFRDGPVKLGRNREFTQCDTDIVGVNSLMAEAEYMMMTNEIYKKLGLNIEIEFNNRKLLSGIINLVFGTLSEDKLRKSIMLIDKFAKLTEEELTNEFRAIVDIKKLPFLRELLNCNFEQLKIKITKLGTNSLIEEGLKEINELYTYLKDSETLKIMKFAPYLARGIDVYTGTVWEVFLKNRQINDVDFTVSLGGGGRYDNIITYFIDDGKQYPAVGMSFGLDVIYEALMLDNSDKNIAIADIYIIPMKTENQALKYATKLREKGIRVEIDKSGRKLVKSMNYANKLNYPFVIVLGENEIKTQKIKIKNMSFGDEQEFTIKNISSIVKLVNKYKK